MSVIYQKKPGFRTTAIEALQGADLQGKIAIVTGGNSGLGLETVKVLSTGGAKVYLCSRSTASGEKALQSIKSPKLKGDIKVAQLDISDFDSIHKFSKQFMSNESRLDYLVLNAGVMACPLMRTKHGFEMQIGTNYFGHYVLTKDLLSLMTKQKHQSRVVILSSVAHQFGDVNLDDINYDHRKYGAWQSYGQNKTALILWGRHLAKQLKDTPVLVYSLHPGGILTNLQRYVGTGIEWLDNALLGTVNQILLFLGVFKTIPQGAATSIYACVAKELEPHSGEYLEDCHVTKSAKYAQDMNKAEKLIQLTEKMVNKVEKDGTLN